jgi:hypothetical protein
MGKVDVHTGFQWENLKEGDHLKDPGVDGRIILKWILEKWDGSLDWGWRLTTETCSRLEVYG